MRELGGISAVISGLFLLHLFSAVSSCLAQDTHDATTVQKNQGSGTASKRGEWVISGYLGSTWTAASPLIISQPALGNSLRFSDIRFDGRSFDAPLYNGYRVGYFLAKAPFLGVETEFIHAKVYSDPRQRVQATGTHRQERISQVLPLGEIVQNYSISHGVNFLLFNLAGRYAPHAARAGSGNRFVVIGRFGAGPTLPHTESTVDGQRQEQYEVGRLGWQLAAGVEIRVWRGLYGISEYKFTRSRQRGKIISGTAESILRSQHGVFGLSYHF